MTLLATIACWAVLWLILAAAFYVAGRFATPPRNRPLPPQTPQEARYGTIYPPQQSAHPHHFYRS